MRLALSLLAFGIALGCGPSGPGSILCNDDEGCPSSTRCAAGTCVFGARSPGPAAGDAGPLVDAGAGNDDAGASDADAGASDPDAGASDPDAGAGEHEAGEHDAGEHEAGEHDAGDIESDDAAPADAGPTEAPCGSLSALRDDFDTSERAWFWNRWADPQVSVAQPAGALRIDLVADAPGSRYGGYSTQVSLPLSRPVSVELVQAPNPAAPSSEAMLFAQGAGGVEVGIIVGQGRLRLAGEFGAESRLDVGAFDAVAHRYWQLRPDGAALRLETSADRVTWTSHGAQPLAPFADGAYLTLMAGTWSPSTAPGSAAFDDLNLPDDGEGLCPLATLRDEFDGEGLDESKWRPWSSAACSHAVAEGTARFWCVGSAVDAGAGAQTRVPLDARESRVTVALAGSAPTGNGGGSFFKVKAPDNEHTFDLWEEDGNGWFVVKGGAGGNVVHAIDYALGGRPERVRFVFAGDEACFDVQRPNADWTRVGCAPTTGLSPEHAFVEVGYWAISLPEGEEGRASFEAVNP